MGKAVIKPLIVVLLCLGQAAQAEVPEHFRQVALYAGVPEKMFYALALAESGKTVDGVYQHWDWTLNIAGKPSRYASRQEMFNALMEVLQSGITNVDIGAMQINWNWKFDLIYSPWTLTEPTYNTKLAAEILRGHYEKTGDWWLAIGKYHRESEEPEHLQAASAYRERVRKIWEKI